MTGPAAESGVDQLWKFQLRKENAALLERLHDSEKLIQAIAAHNNRRAQEAQERIAALEAKLTMIESEEKTNAQRCEMQLEELSILKAQMKEFRVRHALDGELLAF